MGDAIEELPDDYDLDLEREVARLRRQREAHRRLAREEAEATFGTLPRVTLAQALKTERVKVPHRIEGLHRIGYNSTITAKYKTGKTTLGENMLRSLVDGVDFLDRFPVATPAGRVGLLNYELDDNDMLDWLGKLGIKRKSRVALLNLRGQRFTLAHERNQEELTAWCRDMDIEVHLDPHRRAFAGFGSENDNDDVNRFTDTLDVIKKEAGVRDLFLYVHMGRGVQEEGEEHARGATALDDWADQRWILTKKQESRFLYAEGRAGHVPEFGLSFNEETGRLTAVDGNRSDLPARSSSRIDQQARRIADYVAENPGQNTGEVLEAVGIISKGDGPQAMMRAEELDLVHRMKSGRSWRVYPVSSSD